MRVWGEVCADVKRIDYVEDNEWNGTNLVLRVGRGDRLMELVKDDVKSLA
jgi:hypothetical protein